MILLQLAALVAALGWFTLATSIAWLSYRFSQGLHQQHRELSVTRTRQERTLEMPHSLRQWIDAESEPFAREDLEQEAAILRDQLGSWEQAEEALRLRYARSTMSLEEARQAAWRQSGQELAVDANAQDPWTWQRPPADDEDDEELLADDMTRMH